MRRLHAGLAVALLACSTACLAAPDTRLVAKSLASRGDRFIQAPASRAGDRFVNMASDMAVVYDAGAIEVRPRDASHSSLDKSQARPALRYEFAAANPSSPQGLDDSGVTYNFLVGARENWATGLKSYAHVAYRGLWPGIEATYSGDSGIIKYHFDVAAGADARRIAFIVRGADDARITEDGAVEWIVGGKRLRDERPVAFQSTAKGDAIVPASFTLAPAGPGAWRLAFELGDYDREKALTLDPAWTAFSGLVGGNASDQVYGVARDASGNAYACGATASTDLPTLSAYDGGANGSDDAFLVKFNAAGTPQFVTYFGGSGFDACTGIAINAADGSIHVAGGTTSTNFPFSGTGDAAFRRAKSTGDRDAFVAKFGAAGNTLAYAGVIGGIDDDQAMAIALDSAGRAYVTGYTNGTSFPFVTGPGAFTGCVMCAFVARIGATGVATEYAGSFLGNGTVQAGRGIAVAADGSAYVVGETNATTGLPAMAGTFRTTAGNGDGDGFVSKVSPAGTSSYFTILAGVATGAQTGVDRALGVAIDFDGTILVVGETDSGSFPANNAGTQQGASTGLQGAPSGNMDGFIVRLAGDASAVSARSYVGGSRFDTVEGVAVDGAGGVYVAGTTSNTNGAGGGTNGFPAIATTGLSVTNLGQQDGFLARVLSSAAPTFAGFAGGASSDAMHAIAATPDRILSLGGATAATSGLPNTTTGALSGGASASNGVVLRVNPFGPPATLSLVSGTPQSATVNAAFGAPLTVKLADVDGIGLEGVSVTFTAPASGASASLSPAATVSTDSSGIAQVSVTANATGGGPYNVVASSAGVASVNFALTNNKLGQAITFPAVTAPRFVALGAFGVSASATSGLAVSFSSATAGICTVAGTTVTMVAAGTCTIVASQAGDPTYNSATPVPQDIALVATALPVDFNRDGKPDILWRNTANGATYIWHMNGTAFVPPDQLLASLDPSWTLQGVADFNGDGHPDVVWRNSATGDCFVWYFVNGVFTGTDAFLFSLPPEWVIQGVADFNKDGKPDFLMRNVVSGNAFVWYFDNASPIGDQFLVSIDPTWKVEAVGDIDLDGQPDLLFRSTVSGLAFAWNTQYSGGVLSLGASSPMIFAVDPVWEVVQLADWNGDGKPDLLFRNAATGLVFVWYLDGVTLGASDFVFQIDPSWEIVPRR
ncbi:MAG: VCBS repeat-containing protein [Betaproteobacteria bacterium]|nr:VCBS repeat-containing protein [Betaproteobacteria bacterium]